MRFFLVGYLPAFTVPEKKTRQEEIEVSRITTRGKKKKS